MGIKRPFISTSSYLRVRLHIFYLKDKCLTLFLREKQEQHKSRYKYVVKYLYLKAYLYLLLYWARQATAAM